MKTWTRAEDKTYAFMGPGLDNTWDQFRTWHFAHTLALMELL